MTTGQHPSALATTLATTFSSSLQKIISKKANEHNQTIQTIQIILDRFSKKFKAPKIYYDTNHEPSLKIGPQNFK